MITTYLRLDVYFKDNDRYKLSDRIDLELGEDIYNILSGFGDDYAKLSFVSVIGDELHENDVVCFRRVKLKGKGYNWLVCDNFKVKK